MTFNTSFENSTPSPPKSFRDPKTNAKKSKPWEAVLDKPLKKVMQTLLHSQRTIQVWSLRKLAICSVSESLTKGSYLFQSPTVIQRKLGAKLPCDQSETLKKNRCYSGHSKHCLNSDALIDSVPLIHGGKLSKFAHPSPSFLNRSAEQNMVLIAIENLNQQKLKLKHEQKLFNVLQNLALT